VLEALDAGDLYVRKADGTVFIAKKSGDAFTLADPVSKADAGTAPGEALEKIKINNRLLGVIRAALGSLTLMSPDAATRRAAAEDVFKSGDAGRIELLDKAIAAEKDASVATLMREARAAAVLKSDRPEADKLTAIETIRARGDQAALAILAALSGSAGGAVNDDADKAIASINRGLAMWEGVQDVWYGLSLGSVLLLAAIGLAITFGVMGVINMAHGEMVMLGAYATYVVQNVFKSALPGFFDWYVVAAIPVSFLTSALVGAAMERSVIRFLYGRPLETLLATWGISLVLMQAVRSLFGAQNVQVENPSWLSGGVAAMSNLTLPFNRIAIIVFAALVLAGLAFIVARTRLGLFVRGVTQNRPMASCVGVNTARVDTYAFALGSGIAGLAGCALSQVGNVGPDLGQGYIVDSFMVVVLGGVGQLAGTVYAALGLGVLNKLLEGWQGAVLAKIMVLVLIVVFIQKRPQGLFAMKGRSAEA